MQSKNDQKPAVSLEMHAHDSTGFDEKVKNIKTVTKRDGSIEPFSAEELTAHLTSMCGGLNMDYLNVDIIVGKVSKGLPQGVKTSQIVDLCAETCAYMAIVHPDYTMLANKISVTELHKRTNSDIRLVAEKLYRFVDSCDRPAPLLDKRVYEIIMQNADAINARIDYERDFNYDFFGFKTLEKEMLAKGEATACTSGRQELFENVINNYL